MIARTYIVDSGAAVSEQPLPNPGAVLMDFIWRRSRMLGAIALILTVAGISMVVARPHSFTNPNLGAEWQCNRSLFVLTCSHKMIGNETKAGFLDETEPPSPG
jgi:hypothetical protein